MCKRNITMKNTSRKNFDWRKLFKVVVMFKEAKGVKEKEITEENIEILKFYHETLKRKLSVLKTLGWKSILLLSKVSLIKTLYLKSAQMVNSIQSANF